LGDTDPNNIRLTRIDSAQGGGKSWQSKVVCTRPADVTYRVAATVAILKSNENG